MQAKLEIGPRGAGVTWNVGPHIILFPAVSSRSAGRSGGAFRQWLQSCTSNLTRMLCG